MACHNCGSPHHYSNNCTKPRQSKQSSTSKCYSCGKTGHRSDNCPNKSSSNSINDSKCYGCGQVGHRKDNCPNQAASAIPVSNVSKCYGCGQVGHRKDNCPNQAAANSNTNSNQEKCFECNQMGHRRDNCPNKQNSGPQLARLHYIYTCQKCGGKHQTAHCTQQDSDDKKDDKDDEAANKSGGFFSNMKNLIFGNKEQDNKSNKPMYASTPSMQISKDEDFEPAAPKSNIQCYSCKGFGHYSDKCPNNQNSNSNSISKHNAGLCHNCLKPGHKIADCKEPKTKAKCFNCGSSNHLFASCNKEKQPDAKGDIKEIKECCICLDREKDHMVVPCGHFQYCHICVQSVKECSICRAKVTGSYKVFD
jgi:cellular nucleic acid-binding protein